MAGLLSSSWRDMRMEEMLAGGDGRDKVLGAASRSGSPAQAAWRWSKRDGRGR
jgi:hypothetical protein